MDKALDEEYLKVDAQFGGVDQRKIFMYAEKVSFFPYKIIRKTSPCLIEVFLTQVLANSWLRKTHTSHEPDG